MYGAGALPAQHVVSAFDERVERETAWAPHSHATHELLWNESGVSTVGVSNRVWTVTPTLGVWIPAGLVHAATAAAGTWYRTNHFDITRVPRLAEGVAVVEITPLLRLLLTRLTSLELTVSSRELTEMMVLDVIEPAPREITVTIPSSPLLQPIVEALREDPGIDAPSVIGRAHWESRRRPSRALSASKPASPSPVGSPLSEHRMRSICSVGGRRSRRWRCCWDTPARARSVPP